MKILKGMLVVALFSIILSGGTMAESGGSFIQKTAPGSFYATVSALKHAISSNGMMILGELNQKRVLSMTGLNLKGAHAFFVGNPVMGKKLFAMNPAVGAVLPLRVYVWVDKGGKTVVGYFKPSAQLGVIDPMLKMPGQMLDQKFAMIVDAVAK